MANKFKSSARNYTSSNKFIDDYEKLLKKNTGSSLKFASDANFYPGMKLTNEPMANGGTGLGALADPSVGNQNYQAPARREYAALPEVQEQQYQEDQLPENPTAEQMLQAIFKAAWEPQLPSTEQLEQRFQETGEAYPIMSMEDGTVQYSDGSMRQMTPDEPPMPIASMADGSVLWSDGFTREMPAQGLSSYLAGVSGLSQFVFGEDQTVTQDFGNYNPGMGYASGRHSGVDFRTRDLQNRNLMAPVQMTVVQVLTEDMGSPYGNSVLVQLPSGEMLRLSHLSQLGQFQEGQTLQPGDIIGIPGSTGNSTAEHLDVEYYNTDGQLDNPNNFKANVAQYSIANQIVGTSPYQSQSINPQAQPQATQQPVQPQQDEMPAFKSPLIDAVGQGMMAVEQPIKQAAQAVVKPIQKAGQVLGTGIEQANLTGQAGVGLSEALRGDLPAAIAEQATTAESLGTKVNAPELYVGEAGRGQMPLGQTLSAARQYLQLPATGLREVIDQGTLTPKTQAFEGSSQANFNKTLTSPRTISGDIGYVADQVKDKAENLLSTAAKSVDDYADKVTAKAGEGVSALKSGVADLAQNIFKKPQVADVGAKKMIGEDGMSGDNQAPSSLLDLNKVGQSQDNRDAFFKYGGADAYKDYLNPGVNSGYRGALDFNLFKSSVFDSPDAIGNIFGNTYLGKEATDKYRTKETAKYPLMSYNTMGYEDGYDRGEIDNYNRQVREQTDQYNNSIKSYLGSIPQVFSGTNWQMGAPKSARNQFADVALEMKTPESRIDKSLMSMAPMNTPSLNKFSAAANIVKPNAKPTINSSLMSMNKPQMSMASISKPQMQVSKPSTPSQSRPSAPSVSAPKAPSTSGKPLAPMSYAKPYTPAPKPAPKQSSYSSNSSQKSQPYPIMSMANGKVKYSDGSIRSR